MPKVKHVKRDPKREGRITNEIVADCHDTEEQAMGWFSYLEDTLQFPFTAACITQRAISPLRKGDEVEVLGMSGEGCEHEMFVEMLWEGKTLAVPLAQLKPIPSTDAKTKEAVADWHYWLEQGYEL